TVTVNDGAGGAVVLSYEQLMTQYAAQGFVYKATDESQTLIGTAQATRGDRYAAKSTWRALGTLLAASLFAAWSGSPAHAADKATKKAEPRYKLTAGMGYTVCERYVKMLNAFPADAPPPICEQRLHPDFPDFAFPKWEELDVAANMELIRQLERWLHSKNDITWAAKPLPGAKHLPSVDVWLAEVERRIRAGESAPRLRRTELVLAGKKRERLLAYTRDTRQCERDLASWGGTDKSWDYIFLYDEQGRIDPRKLDVLGGTRGGYNQLLLHHRKPYFVATFAGVPKSSFRVRASVRSSESVEQFHGISYELLRRCEVRFNRSEPK
ncbi:MAG: hypothetical protein AB1768_20400, partial [Pseudomonadota bacterium]